MTNHQYYTGLDSNGRVQFTPAFARLLLQAGADDSAWCSTAIDTALSRGRATDGAPNDDPPVSGQTRAVLYTRAYRALRSRLTDEAPEADRFAKAAAQTIALGDQLTKQLADLPGLSHSNLEYEKHFRWQREHGGERFPSTEGGN